MWRVCSLAVLVAVSVACGSSTEVADDTSAGAGPAISAVTEAPTVTDAPGASGLPDALRFSSPLVGGGSIDGASLAGRPTVLWFWAPT